jgi:hypothetical protein
MIVERLPAVFDLILMMLNSLLVGLRGQAAMQADIIALRHQLTVLQRSQKFRRAERQPDHSWESQTHRQRIRATENEPLCHSSSLKHDELMAKRDDLGLNCGLSAKAPIQRTERH